MDPVIILAFFNPTVTTSLFTPTIMQFRISIFALYLAVTITTAIPVSSDSHQPTIRAPEPANPYNDIADALRKIADALPDALRELAETE